MIYHTYNSDFIPVVIGGGMNSIKVKIVGFLRSDTFYALISFLRGRGYIFDPYGKVWYKHCRFGKVMEEEMNELENFLIDNDIVFRNEHPLFRSLDI